jgi:thiamine-phosphate pyrophosphorylase
VAPEGIEPVEGSRIIAAALEAGDAASILIPAGPRQLELAKHLKPLSLAHDTALLLAGDPGNCLKAGADGIHLQADPASYAAARAAMGVDKIIGIECGTSRHLAMTLGELGADYIAFSGVAPAKNGTILSWWSELFEVPCVAFDPANEDDAVVFMREGADFLRPPDTMWRDAETAALTVKSYNQLILGTLK